MMDAWKQWEGELVDGRFRLLQFLGGSDHSAVFLAEGGQSLQKVTLKFVDGNPATAQLQLSRWERAAKLSHSHLVRLLESGRCQLGRATMLYVVSELAQENLSQILPNRPLNPSETEYVLRSVLEVLAYLHGQGLAHGCLKPGNIMAVNEQLKVSSDTICRPGERGLGHQPTVYDPPEITTSGLTPAGDVWSLGITLVEVLTQRPSVGEGIRQEDLTLPDSVPAPFLEIARQCLRLDPQRRWTVPDIAARLLPVSTAPNKKAWTRYWFPAVAAGVALIALLAGSKLLNHGPQTRPQIRPNSPPAVEQPEASKPDPEPRSAVHPAIPPPKTTLPTRTGGREDSGATAPPTASPPPQPRAGKYSAGAVPGAVAERVMPPVPRKSRDTISGKIRVGVRVAVDPSGNVVAASLDSRGPSRYFAKLALEASRHWKFTPPQVDGEAVASEWRVRFEFGRATTKVYPVQASP